SRGGSTTCKQASANSTKSGSCMAICITFSASFELLIVTSKSLKCGLESKFFKFSSPSEIRNLSHSPEGASKRQTPKSINSLNNINFSKGTVSADVYLGFDWLISTCGCVFPSFFTQTSHLFSLCFLQHCTEQLEKAVDELLLGDGFSIVDSTKGDAPESDSKKRSSKDKEKEKEKKPEVKKEKSEEKPKEVKKEEPPKDDTKVNGHDTKSDALLITTEEDLDMTEKDKKSEADTKEEDSKSKKDSESKEKEKPVDKKKQGDLWVSNITRHVKATDLKKHFSRHGKVLTAKIVTNGKSFFGYILMETSDIANKCVRSLHGSSLDGRKITVSRQRPDQRRPMTDRKPTVKATKTDRKPEKKSDDKKSEKSEKPDKKDDALAAAKRTEDRLRREIDFHKREVVRLKRYLTDEQRRLRIEQQKNRSLGRELQEAESKLREERRKMDREREMFEKNQRTDRVKLENDRSMIKKELEEVKKLREYLKRKLEEEARPVERRPRASSPYAYSSKRFRESSGGDKNSKYVEERTRTPPSPPKLSSRSKRSPVNSFVEKERRPHHYSMSEREEVRSLVIPAKPSAPAAPRNIWPSFHQEVWRVPPGTATSSPFSGQSYTRQSEYSSSSTKGPSYSSTQREFSKRDHYTSSSVRKY
ncbi:scaffold attachment factor B1-like, partial [Tribolium madens]|uniref:scaffold attachment factor B1-like n=1 Tax=Tribolium madens TaxID=41895 RepID=UPI001CF74E16